MLQTLRNSTFPFGHCPAKGIAESLKLIRELEAEENEKSFGYHHRTGPPHFHQHLGTAAGAEETGGGAFALGVFVGLNAFDDAVNSDRKLWTTAALSAAGGAVGGYFLGRALDKRRKKTDVTRATEEFYRALMDSQRPSRTADLVVNSRQKASLPNSPSSSWPAIKPGDDLPIDRAGSSCDLSRIYLRAALESMNPPE
jgi:hypothetical protein